MNRNKWRIRKSTEKRLFDGINRLTRIVRHIANTKKTVEEITAAISAISDTPEWKAIAKAEALKMVKSVASQNAKDWREASKQSRRGNEIYLLLREEMDNNKAFAEIIRNNARHITYMPDDVSRHITEHVSTQAIRGLRAEDILEDVRKFAPHISRTRAQLIARTEVAKTNAAITQVRAQEAGVKWYVWQTSEDQRVRSSHKHMQGVACSYQSPPSPEQLKGEPSVGYYGPGEIWNCRCFSAPVIDPDFESWPKKVVRNGELVQMSKAQFEALK